MTEWCAFSNMIIGGTIFPHRKIHKLTRTSPNRRDQNQIDHLTVNSMWRRSLLDVKMRSRADIGSDDQLVTARMRLKLRTAGPKTQINPRYDIGGLQDPRNKSTFLLQLRNRFQVLNLMDEPEVEEEYPMKRPWRSIFSEAGKNSLGI